MRRKDGRRAPAGNDPPGRLPQHLAPLERANKPDGRRAWRGSSDQKSAETAGLDGFGARAAGQLCGVIGTEDVIDATVVLCARARGHRVVTSDPDDLRRVDPSLEVVVV